MDQPQPRQIGDRELATDLKAAVAARRELTPELEDQVIEAFLARIERRVDERVAQQVASSRTGPKQMRGEPVDIGVIAGSFALSIPLIAIAGGIAGGVGIVVVLVALVAVNLLYFID